MNHRYASLFLTVSIFLTIALCAQEPKLILPIGHSLGVASAVFSPDGKKIVTPSLDHTVKIWEVSSGKLLADLREHTYTVGWAAFSPDGKEIVTASEDSTVKIWDVASASLIADMKGHTGKVSYAEFSPDGKKIVTASEDHSAKVWDVEKRKLLFDLKGHRAALWWAHFNSDGKRIITTSEDSIAKVWDAETGKHLFDLKGHNREVREADFSSSLKKIVSCSGDSTVKIWDAETGKLLFDLIEHKGVVSFSRFSPDGKKILTGSDDGTAKVWNADNGKLLFDLTGKRNDGKLQIPWPDIVTAAYFSPDGKKILTVYVDTCIRIWDAHTGKLLKQINRNLEFVNSASFSPDSKKVALALAFAHIEIWDIESGKLLEDLKGDANSPIGFQYSSDQKRILALNMVGSAKLIDAETGTLVVNLPSFVDSKEGTTACYSPDGKKIISTAHDNTAKVYDAATGALLLNLAGHTQPVNSATISHDGKKIYTYSQDSTIKAWDAATGKIIFSLKANGSYPSLLFSKDDKLALLYSFDSIAKVLNTENGAEVTVINAHRIIRNRTISPDGKKIIATFDSSAIAWEALTGKYLYEIKEINSNIWTTEFSLDGSKIILNSQDRSTKRISVKMLEAETGKLITELKAQGSSFRYNVLFHPDGKKFFVPMMEGGVTVWDLQTGMFIRELKGLSGEVYLYSPESFSPDGKKLVLGSGDGTIKVWDIETGQILLSFNEHTKHVYPFTYFSPDGKKIITFSQSDYSFKLWDANTGNFLYTFYSVGRDDYVIMDNYNHFDGTENGRKSLYFTCGTEVIELEQVKDQLWVPNLAERILNGETINAAKLSDLNICNLTPIVDTIGQSALQYRFRITPRLGGLGTTIVYVNGIEVKRYTPQQLQQQKEEYQLSINKKELQKFFIPNKENSISVKALTSKNSISSRSVSINEKAFERSDAAPNLYGIMVGVSDYKGDDLDLKFAAKDAINMAEAVGNSARKLLNTDDREHVFIYKVHTTIGRDRFPEKNSIRQLFTEIGAKAQPNDILLIFFAGHGVVESEKNQFYFLTADASNATVTGALKDVGISTEELAEWIKPQTMKAQKRILIFDACNSGQAIKEIISLNADKKGLLASRGDDKGKQIKAIEKLNEKSGMFILSASASDQKAYEMGKYNQGALTYALLKAIKEEPDILESRQYLNISRWFSAAERYVNELARETGARQQPQIVSTTNFNIGVVDDDVRSKIVLPFEKLLFTRSEFRNTESHLDNLKLRNLIDKKLSDLTEAEPGSSFLYSPEYDGANVYSLNGDYIINGNEVTINVLLIKGGSEIVSRFEVKGDMNKAEILAEQITAKTLEWIQFRK